MKRVLLIPIVCSLCCGWLPATEPEVVFKDGFNKKLGKGWKWIREDRKAWRIKPSELAVVTLMMREPGQDGNQTYPVPVMSNGWSIWLKEQLVMLL